MSTCNTGVRFAVTAMLLLGGLTVSSFSSAGARFISAQSIEGLVVDESGMPLSGVVVMAHWTLHGSIVGATTRELTILETQTNALGRYSIPAWGPKEVSTSLYMVSYDPVLHYFKSGYEFVTKWNRVDVSRERMDLPIRSSEWNGKTIVLGSLPNSPATILNSFFVGRLDVVVRMTQSEGSCNWQLMPLLLKRLDDERLRMESVLGVQAGFPRPEYFADQARCGSATEFMKGIKE